MRTIAQRQPISVKKIYDIFKKVYKDTGKKKLQDMTCEEKQMTVINTALMLLGYGFGSEVQVASNMEYYINNIPGEELKKKTFYDILVLLTQRTHQMDNLEDEATIHQIIERINEYYDFKGDTRQLTSNESKCRKRNSQNI